MYINFSKTVNDHEYHIIIIGSSLYYIPIIDIAVHILVTPNTSGFKHTVLQEKYEM